ncbi:glycosyltransferase [Agreia pratensis]|uniref:glycosyltransferase family 2 protein n=1 Tax=Agreia pratensis TaxID=150121 RepID=UPI00188B6D58|nr:glycosyltransferase [Agreia pratensis]MBF4635789.1 glycosyltransferase [Agreia pratensis]
MRSSIIVPTFQSVPVFTAFFGSLLDTVEDDTQIIIVNDGSGAGIDKVVSTLGAATTRTRASIEITVIRHDRPWGCGQSLNDGLQRATGDVIFFADSDLILLPGWQTSLRTVLKTNPDAGMTAGVLLYPNTGGIQHAGIRIGHSTLRHQLLNNHPSVLPSDVFETPLAAFALFGLTRRVLESVGNLDESYFNGYEDFDFQMRARQAGYRILMDPHPHAYHWERRSGPLRDANRKANLAQFWSRWSQSLPPTGFDNLVDDVCQRTRNKPVTLIYVAQSRYDATDLVAELTRPRETNISVFHPQLPLGDDEEISLTSVTAELADDPNILVFVADNFCRLLGNAFWHERRHTDKRNDLIVDLAGNVVPMKDLVGHDWPGHRDR